MRRRIHPASVLLVAALAVALSDSNGPVAQAFTSARVVKAEPYVSFDKVPPGSTFRLAAAVRVSEGWHINAHKPSFDYLIATGIEFAPENMKGLKLGEPIYPPHVERAFTFTDGKPLRVYEGTVLIGIEATAARDLTPRTRLLRATLTAQACNDSSCLAPARVPIEFSVTIAAPNEPIQATHAEIFGLIRFEGGAFPTQQAPPGVSPRGESPAGDKSLAENTVSGWVKRFGWAGTVSLIFVWGLALNLTPCVYPVIPITLAYFGGQAAGRASRAFSLASIYVLGMCVTYSTLGVIAATTGSILGSALQNPLALVFVAVVLIGLALSMFGLYDIEVPAVLRRKLGSKPGYGGALFMGLTVGLVAAPCVGPIVVSLLVFVGQLGSPIVGFWLFFVLALGLGVPYLLLGGLSGATTGLPRAGAWMEWVKKVFGCILITMALYFLNPLVGGSVARWTIPIALLVSALYLGFMEGSPIRTSGFRVARFTTAAVLIAAATALLLPSSAAEGVRWEPYTEEALQAAARAGRPVIIDFTADWCLPCKELDHLTFNDARVVAASGGFEWLKADITGVASESVQALLKRHEILGAPTIMFVGSDGRERRDLRLTGFEDATGFVKRMKQIGQDH